MSPPPDTLAQLLAREIRILLVPLTGALSGGLTGRLLSEITGWSLRDGVDPATDERITRFVEAYQALDALVDNPPSTLAEAVDALRQLEQLWTLVRQIPVEATPGVDAGAIGRDLAEALVLDYLKTWHPLVYDMLAALTVIRPPSEIELSRISDLISDPLPLLRDEYLPPNGLVSADDARIFADRLFPRLASLLRHLGLQAEYPGPPIGPDLADRVAGGALLVHLQPDFEDPDRYRATLALSPRDLGGPALVLLPAGVASPYWDVDIDLRAATGGLAVGPTGVTLLGASGAVRAGPGILEMEGLAVGAADGSRLEIGTMRLAGALGLDPSSPDYGLSFDLNAASLVLAAGDGDGLLAAILPSDGLRADFDLGLGWSKSKGLHLRGSADLFVTLPGMSAGGVLSVPAIHVGLHAETGRLEARMSAALSLAIGPVRVTVDGAGFAAELTFPPAGGNLGVADLALRVLPPTGVGLAIEAPAVSGGGFLAHEPELHRYTGALHVTIGGKIDLAAWGVLRAPGGTEHWSLVVILAGRIPPIELGWNFRLTALGGVLALHRRMDTDALRDAAYGIRGSLDDLLFPDSPETRLPELLSTVERFFPAAAGSHVAGPMAEIEWGRGGKVNARIRAALLLQLDDQKIALYGTVRVGFPLIDSDSTLRVRAGIEALVDQRRMMARFSITIIEAKLFDSIQFTGGAAFFLRWGAGRTFAFSAGGFHPAYRPYIPAGMIEPPRIGVHWNPLPGVRLDLTQYFAITSTSMQFGAAAQAEVGCSWGKVTGELAYDFLVTTSPRLYMEASLHARVTVSVFGADLLSARLDGTLSGPGPWALSGRVSWSIWIFDISKSFHLEWGEHTLANAEPQSAGQLLADEMRSEGNWTSSRPYALGVLLRAGASTALAPSDEIEVRQSRLPFGVHIDAHEGHPLSDAGVWTLTTTSGSGLVKLGDVAEVFPQRRFRANPSQERPFDAGLVCGARLARTDWEIPAVAIPVDSLATDDLVIDGAATLRDAVPLTPPAIGDGLAAAMPTTSRLRAFSRGASTVEVV